MRSKSINIALSGATPYRDNQQLPDKEPSQEIDTTNAVLSFYLTKGDEYPFDTIDVEDASYLYYNQVHAGNGVYVNEQTWYNQSGKSRTHDLIRSAKDTGFFLKSGFLPFHSVHFIGIEIVHVKKTIYLREQNRKKTS